MNENKFVGTWKLISYEIRYPDGKIIKPSGDSRIGMLIFNENNEFAVQGGQSNRKVFESNDQRKGTPEEIKEAFEGYIAYFGIYEVKDEKTLVHHVTGSLFPNWENGDQIRYYKFHENYLELSAPFQLSGVNVSAVLIWERSVE